MELTAQEIADAAGGEVVLGSPGARASSTSIDSRRLGRGACFVALRAVRDGHAFVDDAFAKGATIAVVDAPVASTGPHATVVRVPDTMDALAALARLARTRVSEAVVVGITGSTGKTATKDLTAGALALTHRVHASPGSFNNEAGVPLTLLGAPEDVEVIVAEMGARATGNIAELASIARPRIGVITNIGLAHAGPLGGRDGIVRAKGELLEALPVDGVAILNDECDATPALIRRSRARVVRVGRGPDVDVRASQVSIDASLRPSFLLEASAGSARVTLGLHGEHHVENALLGAAVALELGALPESIAHGLSAVRSGRQRMELRRTSEGVLVIDDVYNSSPTSAGAAVRALAHLEGAGRRIAVLGEMLELGDGAPAEHEALGALAAELGIDLLIAVGEAGEHLGAGARRAGHVGATTVVTVADPEHAAAVVAAEARPGDAVLVKASRAVGLERVVDALTQAGVSP